MQPTSTLISVKIHKIIKDTCTLFFTLICVKGCSDHSVFPETDLYMEVLHILSKCTWSLINCYFINLSIIPKLCIQLIVKYQNLKIFWIKDQMLYQLGQKAKWPNIYLWYVFPWLNLYVSSRGAKRWWKLSHGYYPEVWARLNSA